MSGARRRVVLMWWMQGRGGEDIEWGTKVWVAACVLREGRSSHVYLWKGMAAFGLARDKNSDGSS